MNLSLLADSINFTASPSLIFAVVLLVVVGVIGLVNKSGRSGDRGASRATAGVQRCPHCRELVAGDATVCPSCTRVINLSAPTAAQSALAPAQFPAPSSAPSSSGAVAPSAPGAVTAVRREPISALWDVASLATLGATVAFAIATSGYDSGLWIQITTAGNFEYYAVLGALIAGGLASWSVITNDGRRELVKKIALGYAALAVVSLTGVFKDSNVSIRQLVYFLLVATCITLCVLPRQAK